MAEAKFQYNAGGHDLTYHIANPDEVTDAFELAWSRAGSGMLWVFQFGAVGTTRVIVWGHQLADALEFAAEYLKDQGWVGYFDDEQIEEAYKEAKEEGLSDYEAQEQATTDMTYTESGYIPSWEWHVSEITWGKSIKNLDPWGKGLVRRAARTSFQSLTEV